MSIEGLWGAKDLAQFLGMSEKTVSRMASSDPERLPPRVQSIGLQRWVPDVCRDWATQQSVGRRGGGRPRVTKI